MKKSPTCASALVVVSVAAAALLLAGCTTSDPHAAFPAMQTRINEQSGMQTSWPITDEERAQTAAAVNALLARELTPDSAAQIALLNNRSLRATLEDVGISQAELAAASRLPNPAISASLRWPSVSPRGPDAEFGFAFDLLNALFLPVRKNIAAEQLASVQQRVSHAVLTLVAEAKTAAYEHMAREELRASTAAIAEINAAALDLGRRQFDAGNINQLELEQLAGAAQQARLDLMRAEADVRASREKLNRVLGLGAAQAEWKLAQNLPPLPPQEPPLDVLEDTAARQRFDLAAALGDAAVMDHALNLKRNTRLLPVGMVIGASTERETDGARVTGPNLQLTLPIFDQGQAEVARLSALSRQAHERAAALDAQIHSEVRAARDSLEAARASTEFFQKTLLPQRTLILRQTLLHYNAMQKSAYELLAAKERVQTTGHDATAMLRDYWLARVELERALGGRLPAPPALSHSH